MKWTKYKDSKDQRIDQTGALLSVSYCTRWTINNSSHPIYNIRTTTTTTTTKTNDPKSNANKVSNWREESKGTINRKTTSGSEKGKKWHIPMGTQSPNIWTQEKMEIYGLLSCCTRLKYCTYAVPMDRQQVQ